MGGNIDRIPGCKIVYDWDAFQAVRELAGQQVEDAARRVAAAAQEYPAPAVTKRYAATMLPDNDAAVVYPDTVHAAHSNARHNVLVKVLDGMGA